MILPAALAGGIRGYAAHVRTVYQGDPYMTRDATTIQTADYENRYGAVPVASAWAVNAPVQQYDTNNAQIPEIPNARSLEILATADFWTTLGTGKVGGPVYSGTPTDAGYLSSPADRTPMTITDNPYQPMARAFTAGQPTDGDGVYAHIGLEITDNGSVAGTSISFQRGSSEVTITEGPDWTASGANASASAAALAAYLNDLSITKSLGIRITAGLRAYAQGNTVLFYSVLPGHEGEESYISIAQAPGVYTLVAGFSAYTTAPTRLPLQGGDDLPVNGARIPSAPTPASVTGMTDRLPLGILVNDSDFLGEDPLRQGVAYEVRSGGGTQATTEFSTFTEGNSPAARLSGSAGTMGMADGAVLEYTAYNAVSAPDGTRRFRIYRGGGAVYVLAPEGGGGPVDLTAGGFPASSTPILKGAVLAGRAYLVRNQYEDAFGGTAIRSYGDEVQMVIVTSAVYGEGLDCKDGYVLDGIISPTDYGKGYAAADRFRLEGKPMVKSVAALHDPVVPLIPYPPEDPADDDPCA